MSVGEEDGDLDEAAPVQSGGREDDGDGAPATSGETGGDDACEDGDGEGEANTDWAAGCGGPVLLTDWCGCHVRGAAAWECDDAAGACPVEL